MKLKRTLRAVAVVAATGSCFLFPQEATLKVGISSPGGPEGLAGIELDIGGAIFPERLLTATDLVADTLFVVPDGGTATVAARLVQDGRTVAGGTAEWDLEPEAEWRLWISRDLHPDDLITDDLENGNPVCGPPYSVGPCERIWRFRHRGRRRQLRGRGAVADSVRVAYRRLPPLCRVPVRKAVIPRR